MFLGFFLKFIPFWLFFYSLSFFLMQNTVCLRNKCKKHSFGGIRKTVNRTVPKSNCSSLGCQSMGIPFPSQGSRNVYKALSFAYAPCGTVNSPLTWGLCQMKILKTRDEPRGPYWTYIQEPVITSKVITLLWGPG